MSKRQKKLLVNISSVFTTVDDMKEIDIWHLLSSYKLVKEMRITLMRPSKNNHALNGTALMVDAREAMSKRLWWARLSRKGLSGGGGI